MPISAIWEKEERAYGERKWVEEEMLIWVESSVVCVCLGDKRQMKYRLCCEDWRQWVEVWWLVSDCIWVVTQDMR